MCECENAPSFEYSLNNSRIMVEDLLQKIIEAQKVYGKTGTKARLRDVRYQAMQVRHNLKDLRVGIIEELKRKA